MKIIISAKWFSNTFAQPKMGGAISKANKFDIAQSTKDR